MGDIAKDINSKFPNDKIKAIINSRNNFAQWHMFAFIFSTNFT